MYSAVLQQHSRSFALCHHGDPSRPRHPNFRLYRIVRYMVKSLMSKDFIADGRPELILCEIQYCSLKSRSFTEITIGTRTLTLRDCQISRLTDQTDSVRCRAERLRISKLFLDLFHFQCNLTCFQPFAGLILLYLQHWFPPIHRLGCQV